MLLHPFSFSCVCMWHAEMRICATSEVRPCLCKQVHVACSHSCRYLHTSDPDFPRRGAYQPRRGSSSNPMLNGCLHYPLPADIDKLLNDAAAEKIREYRADYNNRSCNSISLMPAIASTSGRLHCELVSILFFLPHRETASLQLQEFRTRNTTRTTSVSAALLSAPSSNLRSVTSSPRPPALRINFNIDGSMVLL
jgi:hypothetical protein